MEVGWGQGGDGWLSSLGLWGVGDRGRSSYWPGRRCGAGCLRAPEVAAQSTGTQSRVPADVVPGNQLPRPESQAEEGTAELAWYMEVASASLICPREGEVVTFSLRNF